MREDDYVSGLPTGSDARSGIPEVWLVDLPDQVLLSHRQPVAAEYRLAQTPRAALLSRRPWRR
ncbi:MAG: hypothetical protein M3069_27960 [Chloroflexota bacterium]|nr:hypothetical protein [Chloroflexota bacterium]